MSDAAAIAKAKANLKRKASAAYSKSKEKPSEVKKGGGVPAPIKGGACQFVGYEFGATEKGDPMFQLKLVILEPEEHAGRQFRLFHFINESEFSTIEDATDKLTSDVQLLCGEGSTANTESTDDLFPLLDQASKDKPFMEFDSWVHTYGKRSKKAGEKENRAALQGCIDEEYDPDWYKALLDISKNVVKEKDQADDPKPPTSRTRGQAALSTNGSAPARNSRSAPATPLTPAASVNQPVTRKGARPAQPAPEPEPEPEPEAEAPADDIPHVDDIYGLSVDVEVVKNKKKVIEQQIWSVTVTEVNEEAGTVTVVDENGGEYADVPFDDLLDAPAP